MKKTVLALLIFICAAFVAKAQNSSVPYQIRDTRLQQERRLHHQEIMKMKMMDRRNRRRRRRMKKFNQASVYSLPAGNIRQERYYSITP